MSGPPGGLDAIKERLLKLKASGGLQTPLMPAASGALPLPTGVPVSTGAPVSTGVSVSRGRKNKKEPTRAVFSPSLVNIPAIASMPPVLKVDQGTPPPPTFALFRDQLFRERYLGVTIDERTEDEL